MPIRKRPIRVEDLFALKTLGRLAIAPDGRAVVFEMKRADLAENKNFTQLVRVLVPASEAGDAPSLTAEFDAARRADAPTGRAPRGAAPALTVRESPIGDVQPLTGPGKHSDFLPRFSRDGMRLAFISTRDKGACLFVMSLAGGEPVRLTEPDGEVHDFDWSPDGRRIVFTYQPMNERERLERDGKSDALKARPQFKHITRLNHKLDGAGWWNGQYTHLYLLDVDATVAAVARGAARPRPKVLTRGDYDDREPRFSPDGRLIAFTSNRIENADLFPDNADLYVVKTAGGPMRKIADKKGSCRGLSWSPDGQTIAFIGNPGTPSDWHKYTSTIWCAALTGGRPRCPIPRFDEDCENSTLGDVSITSFEALAPLWSADGARLTFTASARGASNLYSCSARGGDVRAECAAPFNIFGADRAAADGPLALAIGIATNPGDVYLADPTDGWSLQRLTAMNAPALARVEVVEPEEFSVRSGSVEIQGWVIKPPDFRAGRRYPAILEVHGGPHTQYGYAFFHEMQWLAARGYVVVYANPRGSTGRGRAFRSCIHADWGNVDYQDVMAVTDWLAARPYVDRKRIGITGGSYGGYMVNWAVGHTNRFRAAVTQRSVTNIESMYGTSDFGHDIGFYFGGRPWEHVERLRTHSPLTYVKNIRTPLLMEHEEQDHRCPIEQAEQLFTALKVLGRTVELVRFEGESHGLSRTGRPHNRGERLRRIGAWFDKYLK